MAEMHSGELRVKGQYPSREFDDTIGALRLSQPTRSVSRYVSERQAESQRSH